MPISGISTHTCENKAEADWVSTRTSVVSTLESREHAGYARWSNIVSSSPPRRRDSGPFVVSCGSPYIACKPRAAYLVLKDAIRLLILLEILTSSGDVGSKYWSRMRRKVLNCSSEPLGTWHQRKQRDARQEVSHTYVCGDERKTPLSRSSLVVRSLGKVLAPKHRPAANAHIFSGGVARFLKARISPILERQAWPFSLLLGVRFCDNRNNLRLSRH